MKDKVGEDWYELLKDEFSKQYFVTLGNKLGWLYKNHPNVIPAKDDIFNAFKFTRLDNLKVVIVGQSPYHTGNHANGIAFASKQRGIPNSLDVILNSISRECIFGTDINKTCYLDVIQSEDYTMQYWIDQGILLLNSQLTCERGNPIAHRGQGWEQFISFVLSKIQETKSNICYLAFGTDARDVCNPILLNTGSFYISCEHPIAALYQNRQWNNKNCFVEVNRYRKENNLELISW